MPAVQRDSLYDILFEYEVLTFILNSFPRKKIFLASKLIEAQAWVVE